MKKIGLLLVVVIMSSLTALSQKKRDISDATYIIITETEEAIDSTAFVPISQKECLDIKSRYNGEITPDTSIKTDTNGFFRVKTKNYSYELENKNDFSSSYCYLGYSPPLRSHLIGNFRETACSQYFIDSETDLFWVLPSEYDNGPLGTNISPENNLLLTYSSYDADNFDSYYLYRAVIFVFNSTKEKD